MTQHKTLAECKEIIAAQTPYKNWDNLKQENYGTEEYCEYLEKAARLLTPVAISDILPDWRIKEIAQNLWFKLDDAFSNEGRSTVGIISDSIRESLNEQAIRTTSQFIKKEVVSSDVEHAAESFATENNNQYSEDASSEWLENTWSDAKAGFIAGYKHCQSTQQPATINWLTDEEIEKLATDYAYCDERDKWKEHIEIEATLDIFSQGITHAQSKLKERVAECIGSGMKIVELEQANTVTRSEYQRSETLFKDKVAELKEKLNFAKKALDRRANKINELEKQNAELVEGLKEINEMGNTGEDARDMKKKAKELIQSHESNKQP